MSASIAIGLPQQPIKRTCASRASSARLRLTSAWFSSTSPLVNTSLLGSSRLRFTSVCALLHHTHAPLGYTYTPPPSYTIEYTSSTDALAQHRLELCHALPQPRVGRRLVLGPVLPLGGRARERLLGHDHHDAVTAGVGARRRPWRQPGARPRRRASALVIVGRGGGCPCACAAA